jgi:thiamine-phosphate pyrophosphorylase
MTIPSQFGFYSVLTNPLKGYEFLTKLLVDYQIAFVQLRIKDGDESEILRTAEKMRLITLNTSTKLIINDFPEIAAKVNADGTHIGQSDSPIEEVRMQIGEKPIIGLSTHSISQAIDANTRKPDYIGIGPVHATPTKKNPDPVIGIHGMKEMLAVATVPAVVIGGIDFTNLRNVLDAGAKNFCMVRQLTHSENPEQVLKDTIKTYNEYYPGFY